MRELPKDARERLFYGTGPLGSFAAKIQIASAFSIIEPDAAHDLHILREVRNVFGHASHRVTFRNRSIRNRLRDLHAASAVEALLNNFPITRTFNSTRGRFQMAGIGYVTVLENMRENARPKSGSRDR